MIGVHAPAVLCFIFQAHLGCERNPVKQYKNLTYGPHAACCYRVKLQRQRYMEWRTTDNIWKIAIEHTSVRLTYARPNYHFHFCMCIYIYCDNCIIIFSLNSNHDLHMYLLVCFYFLLHSQSLQMQDRSWGSQASLSRHGKVGPPSEVKVSWLIYIQQWNVSWTSTKHVIGVGCSMGWPPI